uniref:IS66 family insertion sequence element accessory protein TnpA n=1 Tax=Adlercreutzia sp. TaxID=1872387 RepID=UPI003AF00CE7
MSVNGDAARRDMWAGRIERCLAADMTVKGWCTLNKVAESSLYKWMARFREEDPNRFPRRSSEASSWMKVARRGIADAVAIVAAPGGGVAVSDPPHPSTIS